MLPFNQIPSLGLSLLKNRYARSKPSGYSLMEMVIAMSITTILLAGLSGTFAIVTKSQTQLENRFATTFKHSTVPQQMVENLELASAIVSYSATAIEFEIPDQSGDGWPEKIKYEWTGSNGPNAKNQNDLQRPNRNRCGNRCNKF